MVVVVVAQTKFFSEFASDPVRIRLELLQQRSPKSTPLCPRFEFFIRLLQEAVYSPVSFRVFRLVNGVFPHVPRFAKRKIPSRGIPALDRLEMPQGGDVHQRTES